MSFPILKACNKSFQLCRSQLGITRVPCNCRYITNQGKNCQNIGHLYSALECNTHEDAHLKICIFMQDQSVQTFLDINELLNTQNTRLILAGAVMSHLKNGGKIWSGLRETRSDVVGSNICTIDNVWHSASPIAIVCSNGRDRLFNKLASIISLWRFQDDLRNN